MVSSYALRCCWAWYEFAEVTTKKKKPAEAGYFIRQA
jgi:hypothetical protein